MIMFKIGTHCSALIHMLIGTPCSPLIYYDRDTLLSSYNVLCSGHPVVL